MNKATQRGCKFLGGEWARWADGRLSGLGRSGLPPHRMIFPEWD